MKQLILAMVGLFLNGQTMENVDVSEHHQTSHEALPHASTYSTDHHETTHSAPSHVSLHQTDHHEATHLPSSHTQPHQTTSHTTSSHAKETCPKNCHDAGVLLQKIYGVREQIEQEHQRRDANYHPKTINPVDMSQFQGQCNRDCPQVIRIQKQLDKYTQELADLKAKGQRYIQSQDKSGFDTPSETDNKPFGEESSFEDKPRFSKLPSYTTDIDILPQPRSRVPYQQQVQPGFDPYMYDTPPYSQEYNYDMSDESYAPYEGESSITTTESEEPQTQQPSVATSPTSHGEILKNTGKEQKSSGTRDKVITTFGGVIAGLFGEQKHKQQPPQQQPAPRVTPSYSSQDLTPTQDDLDDLYG